MKYVFILFIALLSCRAHRDCKNIDQEFVSTFENNLRIIKRTAHSKEGLLEPLTNAYLYMNAVTGIEARISDFDTPHYKVKNYFFEDVEKWEEWYKENKCLMTHERADSLFRVYSYGK